ncbi:hypothetical protein B0H14DRAFT_3532673 [Mycena olivaceomarginata]|nr:hypothetical protein B0H14DRAFT_3532673 [Mycena olivaceomarginata]
MSSTASPLTLTGQVHPWCHPLLSSSHLCPRSFLLSPRFPASSHPAAPIPPTVQSRTHTARPAAWGFTLSRADVCSVLQVHTKAAFRRARCEACIAHASAPGPSARSPLLFAPLSLLPHLPRAPCPSPSSRPIR